MLRILYFALVCTSLMQCDRDEPKPINFYACPTELPTDPDHPLAGRLQGYLDETVAAGLPGMMLTVHDPVAGRWSGAAGKAELIGQVPLQPCQLTRVGSTVKTFTAVALLQLWEQGRVDLDAPITQYLSAEVLADLANADRATVRQLLQHSGGINNYIRSARFQTASLNDLQRVWQPKDLLGYARGEDADFPVGSDVSYSNTGYILLGMIIETITGEPFYRYFEREIFLPHGLTYTRFAAEDPVPDGIIRGYIDLYDNGQLIDATHYSGWDYFTADGGLLSNTHDLNRFMELLFTGKILGSEALLQLTDFRYPSTEEPELFRTGYGLGIFQVDTEFGPAYLHSGDAIGYFATMVHFPEQGVTVSWAANGNYGTLDELTQTKEVMERVFRLLLE